MVVVKVREIYDLHTVKNKMTVIALHTPKPDIIKKNFPGLLMQCKAYRPVACHATLSCASVLPLDPQGVGLAEGDVAPEDVFNPILYKAMSNFGMSQLEARINALRASGATIDVDGDSATIDVDNITGLANEFDVYYGLLSNAHGWKHAMPQAGLTLRNLKPLVWELLYNVGDNMDIYNGNAGMYSAPGVGSDPSPLKVTPSAIRGHAKSMPMLNCTAYSYTPGDSPSGIAQAGMSPVPPFNSEIEVPWINVCVGAIIVPPSRLHELFYRMSVVWEIEFSGIRPLGEITNFTDLALIGQATHYQNYSYEATKKAVTGDEESMLDNDSCMVSSNVEVKKVM